MLSLTARSRLHRLQHPVVGRGPLDVDPVEGVGTGTREATAGEVADALDICTSTFTEHLAAAQRKLLEGLVDS